MKKSSGILISFLIFLSCSSTTKKEQENNTCLSGHIMFLHIGEENSPIEAFLLHTPDDTTYFRYRGYTEDRLFGNYAYGFGYMEDNIEEVDTLIFKKLKEMIVEYKTNNHTVRSLGEGSFKIIVKDKCDSISSDFHRGSYTDSLFTALSNFMQKEKKNKSSERFEYYKKMQIPHIY